MATVAAPRSRLAVRRLPANLLSAPFGLLGLAVVWRTAAGGFGTPSAIADVLAVAGAVVWLVVLAGWCAGGARRMLEDARDPALSPFVALVAVNGLLVGEHLRAHAPQPGDVVMLAAVAAIFVLGGLLLGSWLAGLRDPDRLHAGYYLPTVAGGFLSAGAAATAGAHGLAMMAFAVGVFGWATIGVVVVGRLLLRPPLPDVLAPTSAILVAPPAIAGNAWFLMNGGTADGLALVLAGITVVGVFAQLALLPGYRRLCFSLGFWGFTFSWTAVATVALRWLAIERPDAAGVLAAAVLVAISALVGAVAWRSLVALRAGTFVPAPAPIPG